MTERVAVGLGRCFETVTILIVGVCGLSWALIILAHPNSEFELNAVATRIMSGDSFARSAALLPELDAAENREFCIPLELRSAAVIRLRMYEDAVNASDMRAADQGIKALQMSIERALKCIPTEAFLWFVRYWLLVAQGGDASDKIDNLILSYQLGPREGWISLHRNAYALATYDKLPAAVQEAVRGEFAAIVDAGFVTIAAQNLQGPGWSIRDELLATLSAVKSERLFSFDRALREYGIPAHISGVPEKELRPWDH